MTIALITAAAALIATGIYFGIRRFRNYVNEYYERERARVLKEMDEAACPSSRRLTQEQWDEIQKNQKPASFDDVMGFLFKE